MAYNLYKRLRALSPSPSLLIGTVESVSAYGAVLTLPDGSKSAVRGEGTVGQKVFFRAGIIEGMAPNLELVVIEI